MMGYESHWSITHWKFHYLQIYHNAIWRDKETRRDRTDVWEMFTTILSMRKMARQVRNLQINRQHWLNYTANETLGHQVQKFRLEEVEPILFKFLKHNLECSSYDPQDCRELYTQMLQISWLLKIMTHLCNTRFNMCPYLC
jgi:hypothetical protein